LILSFLFTSFEKERIVLVSEERKNEILKEKKEKNIQIENAFYHEKVKNLLPDETQLVEVLGGRYYVVKIRNNIYLLRVYYNHVYHCSLTPFQP